MRIIIWDLPRTTKELREMPELDFKAPLTVAAVFIAAICVYSQNKDECFRMINELKGPQKLNNLEKQFIYGRMLGKSDYIGKAYFEGATPENDYTPDIPCVVNVDTAEDSYAQEGYVTLYIKTQGALNPRPLILRKKEDNWYLWDYTKIFADIQKPASSDPWR